MNITSQQINALLPQTQCQDCGYKGCLPYAKAVVEAGESIDKCLPGGIRTLENLGQLLKRDINHYRDALAAKAKPKRLAVIREMECIGCTKCIQACPVDAIIGSAKQMHSVIKQECTGCGLCVAPCPVDCIDLKVTEDQNYNSEYTQKRFEARNFRLQQIKVEKVVAVPEKHETIPNLLVKNLKEQRQEAIAAAVARAKAKKFK